MDDLGYPYRSPSSASPLKIRGPYITLGGIAASFLTKRIKCGEAAEWAPCGDIMWQNHGELFGKMIAVYFW